VDVERNTASPSVLAERSHRGRKTCAVCGLTKRHVMNRIARDLGYDVLATGHNLDDEAAVLSAMLYGGREYLLGRDLCLRLPAWRAK
jgi:tRNA(Ile)-lysidine synthase TilS/MesJ